MSTVIFQHSTYPNTQSVVCINSLNENKDNTISTSIIKSEDLFHRLCDQRSRLIRLYDLEIQRQQSTVQLNIFLDKIDQIINEYENSESTNLIIGN